MYAKVLAYAGEHRRYTAMAIACMLVGLTANTLQYIFAYQLIRPLLADEAMSWGFIGARLACIAVCAVAHALLYVQGLSFSHEGAYNTLKNIRVALQGKLEKQPLGTIQDMGVGSVKKTFIDDIDSLELLLAHALPEGFSNVAVPVVVYIFMFFIDWKLALLSLGSLPIGILSMGVMYKVGTSRMNAYYAAAQKMNNTIVEYVNGMEVVKVFNRDGDSYRNYERDVMGYRNFTLAWYRACWPWMAMYASILPCVALVTLPLGAWFVLCGLSTLPNLVLILMLSFSIGVPLVKALSFASTMPQINYKIDALEKAVNAKPLQQTQDAFHGDGHSIRFENVHFSYGEDEVLHGVTLDIPEHSLTALVGESGSGKSTLAKLLVHYYDVNEGCIRLGGQDIREMSLEALNREISFVAQEQFLFNTSLLENIRIGKPDATDAEVLEAAHRAQCDEFLSRVEGGIHAMAGDCGNMLSGGERQRICLARALLKDAPVVVLDEATAFMDPENEEKMNEAIAQIIRDKTVVVIAHRLRSIMRADRICVMEKGNLTAAGTHEELLENSAAYRALWEASERSANWSVTAQGGVRV